MLKKALQAASQHIFFGYDAVRNENSIDLATILPGRELPAKWQHGRTLCVGSSAKFFSQALSRS
ncbi:hypothetical protein [Caballeronia glebae]|uniref:hypothetical protein n=1 Tax=Caballeronia glebae TaxID=1777143 RepID=UPI0038BC9FD2